MCCDQAIYHTKIGKIKIVSQAEVLNAIRFVKNEDAVEKCQRTKFSDSVCKQIQEFLAGKRTKFEIAYELEGTPFQRKVWQELCRIPYGQTRSYKEIAAAIGNDRAYRAVGNASNKNPLPIVVPCHRVVGTNGSLTGYAGGLAIKKQLLAIESNTFNVNSTS